MPEHIAFGMVNQPHSEYFDRYPASSIALTPMVPPRDPRELLLASVSALMTKHYGAENINRLAREAKIGPATVQRIKDRKTSVGIDVVDKVAKAFHLAAWQLLVPGFDAELTPELHRLTEQERAFYSKLREAAVLIAAEPAPAEYKVTTLRTRP